MHAFRTRMKCLHRLLTGEMGQPPRSCEYPPRYLWGDLGLPADRPQGRPQIGSQIRALTVPAFLQRL